jgi:hypothetical protein
MNHEIISDSNHFQFIVYDQLHVSFDNRGNIFTLWTGPMALHFTTVGALLAVRCMQILVMNQHACWSITFRMKGGSYLYSHSTGVENSVSTWRHFSHWRKRFWFSLWSCSAGIFAISPWIFSFSSFVRGYCCILVIQTVRDEITMIKIRWPWWSNFTADNSVPKDIRQSLDWHTCNVGSSWVLLKPAIETSSANSEKNCLRKTCTYLSQLFH